MDLSIIIVTYKSRAYIERCLDSIARFAPTQLAEHRFEIILVDNASHDGTVELVRSKYPSVSVLENSQNEGFSRANNRGIERARGEFVLLLNPDTEVTKGALESLVTRARTLPNFGALAPRLQYPDGTFQPNFYRFPSIRAQLAKLVLAEKRQEARIKAGQLVPVDCAWGAALLLRREQQGASVQLDKNIFLYSEDLELCWRLKRAGLQTYVLGGAVITHAHNKSGEHAYGTRASLGRLGEFKKTLRYVTNQYWQGSFKPVRFWVYSQLEALNATWRGVLLRTLARRRYKPAERAERLAEHAATAEVFSGRERTSPPLTRGETASIVIALTLFVSLALTIAVLLPRGRGNDEDSHVAYVRFIADEHQLPQPFPLDFGINREYHQPPIFYGLGAAWLTAVRPLGLGTDSLRLFMILLGLVELWILFKISRQVLPVGWRAVPLLFFAALPMLAHEFATVNNDAVAFMCMSVLTLALVHIFKRSTTTGWYLVAALAGSAAVLSKLFAGPPVLVLGLAITIVARRSNRLRVWGVSLLMAAVPLALWLGHNYFQTGLLIPEFHLGELAALSPYREDVTLVYVYSFWVVLWQTFVGRLGSWDIVYPIWVYALYVVPVALGIVGAVRLDKEKRLDRRIARWTFAALLAELAALAYLNRDYFQPQARYIYPIVALLLVTLAFGVRQMLTLKTTTALLTGFGLLVLALTPLIL